MRKSVAWSWANTALADLIRRCWRAKPITATVPANLMPKASATARPARSSISSRVWGPLRGGGEPLIGGAEPSGVLRCSRHGSLRLSGDD